MRFVRGIIAFAMLAIVAGGFSVDALAQAKKPIQVRIAIVDIRKINSEASAAKDIRAQIETFREAYVSEGQKQDEALRNAHAELLRKRSVLSPEAFEDARKKFDEGVAAAQRKGQKWRQALDQSTRKAEEVYQAALNKAIAEVANENELTLILRTDQAVFWAVDLDISVNVLQRLNRSTPKVKVPKPGVQ